MSDSLDLSAGALSVRGLSSDLKQRLRLRAAENARSMEAEVRAILETALTTADEDGTDLGTFARALVEPFGGVELELPAREVDHRVPAFAETQRFAFAETQEAYDPTPKRGRKK